MAKGRKDFWNGQYKNATHLKLSDEPAEDLEKFCRYLERNYGRALMNVTTQAVDVGCGNGRNLLYLGENFGMRGLGYDTSKEAIEQARAAATEKELPQLKFIIQDLRKPIPLPDNSVTIVLDMMASHILKKEERDALMFEMLRVLRPNGWVFFKSFLLDEDKNAERMLREHPGPEEGMYMHPEIGHAEYVWTVAGIRKQFGDFFTIHKIEKSFKHVRPDGSAWKRRTVSVYLKKNS